MRANKKVSVCVCVCVCVEERGGRESGVSVSE